MRCVSFYASAAQLSGWTAGAPREADDDCPAPPDVLAKKPACSLVGRVSPGLQLPLSSPYSSGCLSPAGDGLQPAFSSPSFVLCSVLAVSYVRAFRVVAIPQSGLLAQVRSFWLHVAHSCPILTKHCSPRLPRLPALPPLVSLQASVLLFCWGSYCRACNLFLKTVISFSGCLISSASIQKLFCGVFSALKCSFEEFVREKVVSPSYSSAILGPPLSLVF